jgi:CRP/FNR family transcriptional regulator, anaerobic regulatory protein
METSSAATWTTGIAPTESMWLRRLSEFIEPTPAELTALEEAKLTRRTFKRNELISLQGECVKEVYLLTHGWVGSSLEVGSGRRQLANILLPGDFAGLPDIALKRVAATLVALSDVTVDVIPLDRLARLFETAPRFLFMLFVMTQRERVLLMDQLAMVGQSKAIQRVAALILHIHRRLSVLQPDIGNVVDWPLSQLRVAEAVGLTSVHVNRTFRDLTQRGLVARKKGKQIELLDLDALIRLSGLPERSFAKEPDWLVNCCSPATGLNRR